MQPLVLAIEPDLRQAAIVKRIVREKVLADVEVVDSRDAALAAIRTAVPDVLLLSTLLSPRDEDELIAHLRTLEQAQHLQTHTIPQLSSAKHGNGGESRGPRGLLAAFMRKKADTVTNGCDPDLFAEEIKSYLHQASAKKRELQALAAAGLSAPTPPAVAPAERSASAAPTTDDPLRSSSSGSSWSSPFEWKPTTAATNPSSLIPHPESLIADPESRIPDPIPYPIPDPIPDLVPDLMPDSMPEPVAFELAAVEVKRERRPLETVNLWKDSGFAIRDARSGIHDQGSGMSDSILGCRALAEAVTVMTSVAGCRVRRVRVTAAA